MNDSLGFNLALRSLRPIFDRGEMAVLHDVGYPNPDRSHFRSMDIWHTASDADQYLTEGWLGRYLDNQCIGCDMPYHALEIDESLSLSLKGKQHNGFAMQDPEKLAKSTSNRFLRALGEHHSPKHNHESVSYLYKTMIDTQQSAQYLSAQAKKGKNSIAYPSTNFGKDLALIARLILSDTDTRIYYASLTGFDTHANQKAIQNRLLQQYAEAISAFVNDLRQNHLLDDTLIFTFSEFGRRVAQNGSNGTDHGAANNAFLLGGNLKKNGFFNGCPALDALDNGDLSYRIDFRSIYATILDQWLQTDAYAILGQSFERIPVLERLIGVT